MENNRENHKIIDLKHKKKYRSSEKWNRFFKIFNQLEYPIRFNFPPNLSFNSISRVNRHKPPTLIIENSKLENSNWLICFKLEGKLDVSIFENALKFLIKRHESLRLGVNSERQSLYVVSADKINWSLEKDELEIDINHIEKQIQSECNEYARTKFNLDRPPLLRSKLLALKNKSNNQGYLWLVAIHKLLFDRSSQVIFLKELEMVYKILTTSNHRTLNSSLSFLPIQYLDYLEWKNNLTKQLKAESLLYWQEKLRDSEAVYFPTDFPKQLVTTYERKRKFLSISTEEVSALQALAKTCKTSLFTVLLTSFLCLLFRYTNQKDILVGTMIETRKNTFLKKDQIKNLIGSMSQDLIIREEINSQATVKEVIEAIHSNLLESSYHFDVSLNEIAETMNSTPVNLDNLFIFQEKGRAQLTLPGINATLVENNTRSFQNNLILELKETEGGSINGFFEYNSHLYYSDTIERLIKNYLTFLQEFTNSENKISQINFLSQEEKNLILSFNKTPSYNQVLCIHDIVAKNAEIYPDKPAIVFEDRQVYTYKELNQLADGVAYYLLEKNIQPKSIVAVSIDRSVELIIVMLGVLKAGCAVICLDASEQEQHAILTKIAVVAPKAIIVHEKTEKLINEKDLPIFKWEEIKNQKVANINRLPIVTPDDLALIAMTSGTTGTPKGVMVPHRGWTNWINYFESRGSKTAISSESRIFLSAPTIFDAFFWEVFCLTLGLGATGFINDSKVQRDGESLKKFFGKNKITIATFTPTILSTLDANDFPTIECLFAIGEALSKDLIIPWLIQKTFVINGYGPTEVTAGVTLYLCDLNNSISIGKPIDNMTVYILDEHLKLVPIGVVGEIYIGGVGISSGYLNQIARTTQAFMDDPFLNNSKKMYKTGDKGCFLPDGNIEFKGRMSDSRQVKLHGVRIELSEIESLLQLHPNIASAHVKLYNESNQYLVAYVVPKEGRRVKMKTLKEYLNNKGLSKIKQPKFFMELSALPITKNGKLDERALPKPKSESKESEESSLESSPPKSETEQKLHHIWKELFPYLAFGTTDNFFEIGGDSRDVTVMLSRINRKILNHSFNKLSMLEIINEARNDFNIQMLAKIIDSKLFGNSLVPHVHRHIPNSIDELIKDDYTQILTNLDTCR